MPATFHVYCPKAPPKINYSLAQEKEPQTLGVFQVQEPMLKRLCMAIDMPYKSRMIIDPPFQDTIRNRIGLLLGTITKDSKLARCAGQMLYILGIARALDSPVCWTKKEDKLQCDSK